MKERGQERVDRHHLNIQHSKGDKLVKSILITELLLCLAVSTLHGKGQAQSQVEEADILIEQARQYLDQGRYDEAEPLYKRAIAIREKALGYKHPDLLMVLTNYADLLRKMSRGDEAARLDARVVEIRASANPKKAND
jgi:tetratricopeptide (TPR) repeat protein